MSNILLIADEPWIVDDVSAALHEHDITVVSDPREAADAWNEARPDAVIVDLQVSSMGGMAVTRAVRDRARAEETGLPKIVLLLDRDADAFLAGRAGATAWVRKPFGGFEVRDLVQRLTSAEPADAS
jgi:CheY-like chemotaxis protein